MGLHYPKSMSYDLKVGTSVSIYTAVCSCGYQQAGDFRRWSAMIRHFQDNHVRYYAKEENPHLVAVLENPNPTPRRSVQTYMSVCICGWYSGLSQDSRETMDEFDQHRQERADVK